MSGFCYNEGCLGDGTFRCSECKMSTYCSAACQKKAWPTHKMECKINKILNEQQAAQPKKAPKQPRITHCTGCGGKFAHDCEDLGCDCGCELQDDDDEGTTCEDTCEDCGYRACESCVSHHSRGSCYCEGSNFGRPYCSMEPRWYHMSSRTGRSYKGDRHPDDGHQLNANDLPEAFEESPRECNNCGEVQLCLRKEHL